MDKKFVDFQNSYKSFTFKGKRGDEEILLLLRRHWLVLLFRFVPVFFVFVFLIFVDIWSSLINPFSFFNQPEQLFDLAQSFAWMFFWLAVFVIWIDYYFDVWIVTNQRIVSMEQKGLFSREISELEHEKIQDVTTEIRGVIPTLLKYGFVFIQTAGEKSRFIFKQVPNPTKIRTIIMQLQKYKIRQKMKEEGEILRGKA